MTTPVISDYLTKQIYIEKNIACVTYRSLSRQFSLHVNTAKNELATYHHDAPYQSQNCSATFLLSGTLRSNTQYKDQDEDVDMDCTPKSSQGEREEDDDSEEVQQTSITIVNERDLEAAKALYDELHSIHVYSLSPSSLHDAGLLCGPTEFVRNTDKAKGPEYSVTVGRVVGKGIKMGTLRKGKRPVAPAAPIAGPSKLKQATAAPEAKAPVKAEVKPKPAAVAEKPKEKPKASGKLEFFKKPKETTKIKKAEPPVDIKKKIFFSKPAASPSSSAPSVASAKSEKEPPARGVKRKSSVGLESRERTPENPAVSKEASTARVKGRVVLSDDESDTAPVKSTRGKAKASFRSEIVDDSEAEREAMALMDIDDDQVEKVSREPSTNVSDVDDQNNDRDDAESTQMQQDEDVSMVDDTSSKPKPKKRKAKVTVPVGQNGLKKRKVTKTRKTEDANGYTRTEDYSDWESVDGDAEPEAPAPLKAKAKSKASATKKEDENTDMPPPPPKEKDAAPKKGPVKSAGVAKAKPATKSGKAKGQNSKGLLNFFGPTKKT